MAGSRCAWVLLVCAGCAASVSPAQNRVVALTGTDGPFGPGLGAGIVFDSFGSAIEDRCVLLNALGRAAFTADLTGANFVGAPAIVDGVWFEGGAGPQAVALAGDTLFDDEPIILGWFTNTQRVFTGLRLDGQGRAAWISSVGASNGSPYPDPARRTVMLRAGVGQVPEVLARQNDPITDQPGGTVETLFEPVLDAFENPCVITGFGPGSSHGILRFTGPSIQTVASTGDPAGDVAGAAFDGAFNDAFSQLNIGGLDLIVLGRFAGAGVGESDDTAVFAGGPASWRATAREGFPAPGSDAVYDAFVRVISTGSRPSFIATLRDGTPGSGVFSEVQPGDVLPVAVAGQPAVGLPGFEFFSFSATDRLVGSNGRVTFTARARRTSFPFELVTGLWHERASFEPQPGFVAKQGDRLPGTPEGAELLDFGTLARAGDKGAFVAVWGAPPTYAPYSGVWGITPSGDPVRLIGEGDTIEVTPGDGRTLVSFEFIESGGDSTGLASPMTPDGTLIGVAGFADGSQAVMTLRVPDSACAADLSQPFGVLNFFDIQAYIALYNALDPIADLALPLGVWNIFDLQAYISLYNAGCP